MNSLQLFQDSQEQAKGITELVGLGVEYSIIKPPSFFATKKLEAAGDVDSQMNSCWRTMLMLIWTITGAGVWIFLYYCLHLWTAFCGEHLPVFDRELGYLCWFCLFLA